METATLKPFLRKNLDILFVGLNPAKGSNDRGHYFSVNQAFWNQLRNSGLILENVNKDIADECIFGNNNCNYKSFNYGITDLITHIAESDSKKIIPKKEDCKALWKTLIKCKPKIAILLHWKVIKYFFKHINKDIPSSNSGELGKIIPNSDTIFFSIAFPHGNRISSTEKEKKYIEVKKVLDSLNVPNS